ncbi:MAG: MarR family transcriptional regulator [Rhodospirillaceae bacterium]|nr:MarR family transcriptional regulator [Rhodospirillaceae bacterium]MBT3494078.1 MarR family transcriptional regulator [Rhodospirillaceae bacterium]MBT3779708.1 MarR family transcriptional regulator [Rhodospirillaceae bacterium]MBT3977005.1 MarR family transcriptional regulator [Rhodospirillaceae bacterium]MBT4170126.1 MarR family transcriptional regulator [Rhodospirillaceae bacterium]
MATTKLHADRVEAVRAFNRFYTGQIGVLREGLLDSKFPLMEARIMYELDARGETTARELSRDLGLDPGYLSRVLNGLSARGLVEKTPAANDRRKNILSLSPAGREEFTVLEEISRTANGKLLAPLSDGDQLRLVEAMARIHSLLSPGDRRGKAFVLRPHRPGDMGDVIALHGRLYPEMFGWDETFEALVATIAADFIRNFDPEWECSWIAEVDGEFAGSAFVVKVDAQISKLRLMIVDGKAQGSGIARALLDECLRFARRKGYGKMTLWTNDVQTAARALYASAGFVMVHAEPGHDFGVDLVAETWELKL